MASLLFITRTWEGHGGLQRFSHALWEGWQKRYGDGAQLLALEQKGFIRGIRFALKAVMQGIAAARAGTCIHLGDASLAPIAFLITCFTSARISANACGLDLVYPPRWYQFLLRKTWNSIDVFCCNSEATAEVLYAKGWQGRIVVIPCPIDSVPARVQMPSDPTVLLLGRLVPRKGAAWFVREVMPLLRERISHVRCVIIGEGPEEASVRHAITEKNLASIVTLAGAVSEQEKDRSLRSASVLVMPNVRRSGDMEGFGIVCLEASVRGVPVVAARLEGLRDSVIEGKTGRFFASGNAEECANVSARILEDSWNPEAVRQTTLERFSNERILLLYDELFR
jgi:glycosyltransferase involved in cell wall biosynthesis